MGSYFGENEDEALDYYSKDAGYTNYADLKNRLPYSNDDGLVIEEVNFAKNYSQD